MHKHSNNDEHKIKKEEVYVCLIFVKFHKDGNEVCFVVKTKKKKQKPPPRIVANFSQVFMAHNDSHCTSLVIYFTWKDGWIFLILTQMKFNLAKIAQTHIFCYVDTFNMVSLNLRHFLHVRFQRIFFKFIRIYADKICEREKKAIQDIGIVILT